jgi:hypothetical protein
MNHSGITEFKRKSVVGFEKKFNNLKDESKNKIEIKFEIELKHKRLQ